MSNAERRNITINNVRLSYPNLFKEGSFISDSGVEYKKFSAKFLIKNEDKENLEKIETEIQNILKENKIKYALNSNNLCLKDSLSGKVSTKEEYKGHKHLGASNKTQPFLFDQYGNRLDNDSNLLYPGCYVNAVISLWYQNSHNREAINANLVAVQFFKDGEPFSSAPREEEISKYFTFQPRPQMNVDKINF